SLCCRSHLYLLAFPTRRSSDLFDLSGHPGRIARRACGEHPGPSKSERPRGEPRLLDGGAVPGLHPNDVARPAFSLSSAATAGRRSEEHTSELHHLGISYAVFCL